MKDFVADHMSTDVVVTQTSVPLGEAVRLMKHNKIRHLCVVADTGQLVGILSDRDISRALPSMFSHDTGSEFTRILDMTYVSHVMTHDPMVVSPTMPLARAALLLRDFRISALPVVDKGHLVGILTTSDCLSSISLGKSADQTKQSAA